MTTQHRRDTDDVASGRNDGWTDELLRDRLAQPEEASMTPTNEAAERLRFFINATSAPIDKQGWLADLTKALAVEREAQGEQPAPLDMALLHESIRVYVEDDIAGAIGDEYARRIAEHQPQPAPLDVEIHNHREERASGEEAALDVSHVVELAYEMGWHHGREGEAPNPAAAIDGIRRLSNQPSTEPAQGGTE